MKLRDEEEKGYKFQIEHNGKLLKNSAMNELHCIVEIFNIYSCNIRIF